MKLRHYLRQLLTDPATGQASHTRLWSNVAHALSAAAFAAFAWRGTLTAELWLVYLGFASGSAAFNKFLNLRYGQPAEATPRAPETAP
jgi:hypothetical protein